MFVTNESVFLKYKSSAMLIISDLSELLALNKLLRKVKFSASLDSEDLEEFAASPLLAAITQRVGEEFLNR